MTFHPLFAIDTPIILIIIAGLAVLLFGADRLPKLARSAGLAKKEFLAGQAEADAATAKMRDDAATAAQSNESKPPSTPES